MTSKLYVIFLVKKKVHIQLYYKVCWNKCSVERFTIFSMTLSKDTCSNKLGLSKSPETWYFLCYRPLNIIFKIIKMDMYHKSIQY